MLSHPCLHHLETEAESTNESEPVSDDAVVTYKWIKWIVATNQPLNVVEDDTTLEFARKEGMPVETLAQRMEATMEEVISDIKTQLPKRFGIAFDRWSDNDVHYVAIFAVGPGVKTGKILLGFSAFDDPSDLTDQEHLMFVDNQLGKYNCTLTSNVAYFVGDDCSVNRTIATDTAIPLIVCHNHKLNLAVKRFCGLTDLPTDSEDSVRGRRRRILDVVGRVMVKLKSKEGKAALKPYTRLVPIEQNETHWFGYYFMLQRFLQLWEPIQKYLTDTEPLVNQRTSFRTSLLELLPSTLMVENIRSLVVALTRFRSVSLLLKQKDGKVTLDLVRACFDKLLSWYPMEELQLHLAPNAAIANNPEFEDAIVKHLQRGALTREDEQNLEGLLVHRPGDDDEANQDGDEMDFITKIIRDERRRVKEYVDMRKIPVTSNIVERFFGHVNFSHVKETITEDQDRLTPSMLECIMFMKLNPTFITSSAVHRGMVDLETMIYANTGSSVVSSLGASSPVGNVGRLGNNNDTEAEGGDVHLDGSI